MVEPTNYKVETKEEVRVLNKRGEVETHYRIYATTKKGTYFHIEVSEDQLDKAPDFLATRARALDSI